MYTALIKFVYKGEKRHSYKIVSAIRIGSPIRLDMAGTGPPLSEMNCRQSSREETSRLLLTAVRRLKRCRRPVPPSPQRFLEIRPGSAYIGRMLSRRLGGWLLWTQECALY